MRISNPDHSRPFSSLEDAVDRLLPYHVFMDETPEAGDLREAEAANAPLAASRKEAWLAECLAKTMQFQQMVVQLHKRMDAAEERLLSHTELPSFMLCKRAEMEEARLHLVEKNRADAAKAAAEALKHAQELRAQQLRLEAERAKHEAALKAQAALAADGIYRPQDLPFELKYQQGEEGGLAEPMEVVKVQGDSATDTQQRHQQQQQSAGRSSAALRPADSTSAGAGPAATSAGGPPAASATAHPPTTTTAGLTDQQQQQTQAVVQPGRQTGPGGVHAPQRTVPPVARPPQVGPVPAAQPPRALTDAEKQAEKQKRLQMMAQRIKQRR